MLCFSKGCGFAAWESQLLRRGGRGGFAAEDVAKFAPRLRARALSRYGSTLFTDRYASRECHERTEDASVPSVGKE